MADTRQYPNPGDKELPEVNADDEGKVLAVVKGAWDKAGSQIELPVVTSEDNGKLLGVTGGKWDSVNAPTELPAVTNEDNGRILQVSSGTWTKQNMPTELPAVTATDNGKVLGVADGNWGVVNAPSGGVLKVKLIRLAESDPHSSDYKKIYTMSVGEKTYLKCEDGIVNDNILDALEDGNVVTISLLSVRESDPLAAIGAARSYIQFMGGNTLYFITEDYSANPSIRAFDITLTSTGYGYSLAEITRKI